MLKFNLFAAVFFLAISIQAQNKGWLERKNINITKNGPYFGIQKGKFIVAELGGERQWKDFQFRKPKTHALNIGFSYDFLNNVLGYDLGYWYKPSNIGLTYGSALLLRSDFTNTKFGFAPVIGYKIWQLHVQTGYQFLLKTKSTSFETNTLFISLRFVLINNTKIKK
jgi:hypothetical protein